MVTATEADPRATVTRKIMLACAADGSARQRALAWVAAMGWGEAPPGACGWVDTPSVLPDSVMLWHDLGARVVMLEYDAEGTRVGALMLNPETLVTYGPPTAGLLASREGARRLEERALTRTLVVCGSPWQWLRAACRWEKEGIAVYGVRSLVGLRQLVWPDPGGKLVVVGERNSPHGRALTDFALQRMQCAQAGSVLDPVDRWWSPGLSHGE